MSAYSLDRPSPFPQPIGSKILIPSGQSMPSGYFALNGQTISSTTYSALAATNVFPVGGGLITLTSTAAPAGSLQWVTRAL